MKELVFTLAQALVDQPDLVSVTEFGSKQTLILELSVAKTDIGKIIGKQGRNVRALRTILSAVSAKEKRRTILEITE